MLIYTTGNLFDSQAEALVNAVNCEGYMGKGIAYQFKLKYPNTNKSYVIACKKGALRIGTLHWFRENGKMIINFPTKDMWRMPSRIEYIEVGLNALIGLIKETGIKSVAIPALGSGNGGLDWEKVRPIIEERLQTVSEDTQIVIYEPKLHLQ